MIGAASSTTGVASSITGTASTTGASIAIDSTLELLQQLVCFRLLERFQLGLRGWLAQLELPLGPLKGPLSPLEPLQQRSFNGAVSAGAHSTGAASATGASAGAVSIGAASTGQVSITGAVSTGVASTGTSKGTASTAVG